MPIGRMTASRQIRRLRHLANSMEPPVSNVDPALQSAERSPTHGADDPPTDTRLSTGSAADPGTPCRAPRRQHVDSQTSLSRGQRATIELKLLVIRGSLDHALERAIRQRESLK